MDGHTTESGYDLKTPPGLFVAGPCRRVGTGDVLALTLVAWTDCDGKLLERLALALKGDAAVKLTQVLDLYDTFSKE